MAKPKHIAIILDGNGRWGKKKYGLRAAGHKEGVAVARKIIRHAVRSNLAELTLFTMSTENLSRPRAEVSLIAELFSGYLQKDIDWLVSNNVQFDCIGDHAVIGPVLRSQIASAQQSCANNTGMRLHIAYCYSGRWHIQQVMQELHTSRDIDDVVVRQAFTKIIRHEPDLLIRTGGHQRLSNFMLWHLAYTELLFLDTLWPDFNEQDFDEAVDWFASRVRNHGQIEEMSDG